MHNVELPQDLIDFVMSRRGRMNVFDDIDPTTTAMLVIDMQNAYVEEGAPLHHRWAPGIIPAVNSLAASLRAAGGLVVWLQHTTGAPGSADYWSTYFDNFVDPSKRDALADALMAGSHYHALSPELDVSAADQVMLKTRFSALISGSSDLEACLRSRDINTVIVTGTLTNVCCESTARDAMMLNYRVFMPMDCTAARSDNDHLAGLRTVYQAIGDVRTGDDVIKMIKQSATENRGTN